VIETMIINVDRKTRSINLSIKAKDQVEQSQAMQKLASDTAPPAAARPIWARCSRPSSTSSNKFDPMTKSELIARLAERFPQLVAKDADFAVKMILDALTSALVGRSHRDPRLRQFCAELPAAACRPQSQVGRQGAGTAKYVPHFKAGKELRERVDYRP
jgi:integration host factor subunit beta